MIDYFKLTVFSRQCIRILCHFSMNKWISMFNHDCNLNLLLSLNKKDTQKKFLICLAFYFLDPEARISKMFGQNSNHKISAHPDLATDLHQILISTKSI